MGRHSRRCGRTSRRWSSRIAVRSTAATRSASRGSWVREAFDIAFADPPYAHEAVSRLVALFRHTPFARILSVEHAADQSVEGSETRRYGDTAITFIHRP